MLVLGFTENYSRQAEYIQAKLQHTLTIFNILAQSGKVTAVRKDILYNWIILDRKLKKVISNKKIGYFRANAVSFKVWNGRYSYLQ